MKMASVQIVALAEKVIHSLGRHFRTRRQIQIKNSFLLKFTHHKG